MKPRYIIVLEDGEVLATNNRDTALDHTVCGNVIDLDEGKILLEDGQLVAPRNIDHVCLKCGKKFAAYAPSVNCEECLGAEPDDLAEYNKNEARDYDGE